MSVTRAELDQDLRHATSSQSFVRHPLWNMLYTEGIAAMAEQAAAYWLIDAVGSHILCTAEANPNAASFQVWTLTPNKDGGAVLTMKEDSGRPDVVRQEIEYTDFPLEGEPFEMWVCSNGEGQPATLLLPSEY